MFNSAIHIYGTNKELGPMSQQKIKTLYWSSYASK